MGVVPRVWCDVSLKEVVGVGEGAQDAIDECVRDLKAERLGELWVFLLILLDKPVDEALEIDVVVVSVAVKVEASVVAGHAAIWTGSERFGRRGRRSDDAGDLRLDRCNVDEWISWCTKFGTKRITG